MKIVIVGFPQWFFHCRFNSFSFQESFSSWLFWFHFIDFKIVFCCFVESNKFMLHDLARFQIFWIQLNSRIFLLLFKGFYYLLFFLIYSSFSSTVTLLSLISDWACWITYFRSTISFDSSSMLLFLPIITESRDYIFAL